MRPTALALLLLVLLLAGCMAKPQAAKEIQWETRVKERQSIGERLSFDCPADGDQHTVWGTGTYTDDSSVCTAAVHAGVIALATGGRVTIEVRPGAACYQGTERNGIASADYGAWEGSFSVVGAPEGLANVCSA